ncbi:MAG TPA: transketolase C-terminal domain-containing protein [Gemmatimonadaceae bacterium]|nr:transketolase C-terminal domain-containing protein [Gemmatimonadaceae bacterium]
MRETFIRVLSDLASSDPRVLLLTADLGYTVLETFAETNPEQFFNVGVAEQNMVGLATGLAEAGFIPFVYSIATFASLRAYEFIRNGPVRHRLPVRIVGVGGGFEYGSAGATHYALEDVGAWRMQPDLCLIAPADFEQADRALRATWNLSSPIYYRLGKNEKAKVPGLHGEFELGRAQLVREGDDLVIVAMGAIAIEAVAAADLLSQEGIEAAVVVVASVNPAPVDDLAAVLARFPLAITAEAHYRVGGVGSLVAEVIAEREIKCRLERCGVRAGTHGVTGSERFLNDMNGISGSGLAAVARGMLISASGEMS